MENNSVMVPSVGFGSWCIGDDVRKRNSEIEVMQYGFHHFGMKLFDTAEMYGDGRSEQVIGEFLQSVPRENVFVVDKILPKHAVQNRYEECCIRSLERLKTSYIDLYLLHWRGNVELQEMVDEMEGLVEKGLIRYWGVSNFDVRDMEELFCCQRGNHCFANQVLYNLSSRGVEYDLIPWCVERGVMVMAYSPLGNSAEERNRMAVHPVVKQLASDKRVSAEALLLKFVTRTEKVTAVFKTSSVAHLRDNMSGMKDIEFSEGDMIRLNAAFPPPEKKMPLEKI
ncbi:MAG: aldo/keto reductase [Lachnospiraceae bacterium]|nr:aldo/keto reductase [Lachnospiraceae bacterium]